MSTIWRQRMILVAPFVAIVGLLVFTPSDDGPTICPFALCTGGACPGCGMTRAASSLVKGDLNAALSYHPLVPLIAIQLISGWVWFVLQRAGRVGPLSERALNSILIATTLALVGVWIARLVTGTLPPV